MNLLALASPLLFVLPTPAAQDSQSVPIVRQSGEFQILCHLPSETAADQMVQMIEALRPRARELYGWPEDMEFPKLTLNLYPTAEAYREVDMELTGGNFQRNLAFAHHESMTAHVALQPELSKEALEYLGLSAQTLRLLAHEAAHLYRYAWARNYRSHPDWLADGAASCLDEQVSMDLETMKSVGDDPNFSDSALNVQRLLERDELPTIEELWRDQTDELEFHERYDVRWLLFRFLRDRKNAPKLDKLLQATRRMGGSTSFTESLAKEAESIFGKSKLKSLNRGFRKYIESFEPQWDEVLRTLWRGADGWRQAAFDSNAIAWRREDAGKKPYGLEGRLRILPGGRQQMNVLLGLSEEGFVSVSFSPGAITIFEYLSQENRWVRRASVDNPSVKLNDPFGFEVRVAKDVVRAFVEGQELIATKIEELTLTGPWGLGAQSTSAGVWMLEQAP